jgi:hypothetical protein
MPINYVNALAVSGKNVFAGLSMYGVYLSTDSGASWTQVNAGLTSRNVISFGLSGENLFAGTRAGGVFISTNNGTSWNQTALSGHYVHSIAVLDTTLFAGTEGNGVFRLTNTDSGWTVIDSNLTSTYVSALALSNTNIFAGTYGGGVFISTDNGANWTAVNNGLTNKSVMSLAVSGENLFAGTLGGGVFISTDDGSNWTQSGLATNYVYALAIDDTNIFAGTDGNGVWKRPLSEMIADVKPTSHDLPTQYALNQNYPNPFNPNTTINYHLPTQSNVTLKVYDVLGREVATLVNGVEEPGYKLVTLDASRLSSGVYYYRLQAGNYVETKKLVLLK